MLRVQFGAAISLRGIDLASRLPRRFLSQPLLHETNVLVIGQDSLRLIVCRNNVALQSTRCTSNSRLALDGHLSYRLEGRGKRLLFCEADVLPVGIGV